MHAVTQQVYSHQADSSRVGANRCALPLNKRLAATVCTTTQLIERLTLIAISYRRGLLNGPSSLGGVLGGGSSLELRRGQSDCHRSLALPREGQVD